MGPSRTIMLGDFWVDLSGALLNGLPQAAFMKKDAQSDLLHALLVCPEYFVTSVEDTNKELRTIPWHSRGALLFSVTTALAYSPALHTGMTTRERAENALTGFIAWDLFMILSARRESQSAERVGSCSMSHTPVMNLQNVSLSTVLLLLMRPEA